MRHSGANEGDFVAAGYLDVAVFTSLGGGHLNHLTGAILGPFSTIPVPF